MILECHIMLDMFHTGKYEQKLLCPFITSNRPKLGIDFGLHLLILATFYPRNNILRVGFHDRPP